MSYLKTCNFGKKQLEISSDTKVALRTATKQEAESFKRSYWGIPETPVLTEDFLNKLMIELQRRDFPCHSLSCDVMVNFSKKNPLFCQYTDEIWLRTSLEKIYPSLDKCQINIGYYSLYENKMINSNSVDIDLYDIRTILKCIPEHLEEMLVMAKKRKKEKDNSILSSLLSKNRDVSHYLPESYSFRLSFLNDNRTMIDNIMNYCDKMDHLMIQNDYLEFIKAMDMYRLRVLQVDDEIFFENFCDFDVLRKYEEIQSILKKINNSHDVGENRVEYEIKWFLAECDLGIIPIKSDCESKYRYNSIMLCKLDFINEPQEYDHILVTPAGIVIIETKNWKGRVEIRNDGKWLKEKEDKTDMVGIENPGMQMHRHELLMKKILPEVPIYNVLCFSNSSVVIDGIKNFSDYPIIRVEQLREFLGDICSNSKYTGDEMNSFADIIEKHKINKF
jgi:hypothetical protein